MADKLPGVVILEALGIDVNQCGGATIYIGVDGLVTVQARYLIRADKYIDAPRMHDELKMYEMVEKKN